MPNDLQAEFLSKLPAQVEIDKLDLSGSAVRIPPEQSLRLDSGVSFLYQVPTCNHIDKQSDE